MNHLQTIINLLSSYKEIEQKMPNAYAEYFALTIIKEELEWQNLTDEEKQRKRIVVLKMVKKVLTPETKNVFDLDDSIIDLYEAVQNLLDDINKMHNNDLIIVRLKSMLIMEKFLLNESRDAKKIRYFNHSIMKNLIRDVLDNPNYEKLYKHLDSKIHYLESKLDNFYKLAVSFEAADK